MISKKDEEIKKNKIKEVKKQKKQEKQEEEKKRMIDPNEDCLYKINDNNELNDLELALIKVKSDGIIAGDDYVDAKGKWGNDVIRAVNDFATKHNLHVKSINDQFLIKLFPIRMGNLPPPDMIAIFDIFKELPNLFDLIS